MEPRSYTDSSVQELAHDQFLVDSRQEEFSDNEQQDQSLPNYQLVRDRTRRVPKPTQREITYLIAYALMTATELDKHEPSTYEEAVECKDSKLWIAAMKEVLYIEITLGLM